MKKIQLILMLLFVSIVLISCNSNLSLDEGNSIKMPLNNSGYEGGDYLETYEELKKLGFTNIEYNILYDLTTGWLVSDGAIEYVSIDGEKVFEKGDVFDKESKIVIAYHTFKSNKPLNEEIQEDDFIYDDAYNGQTYIVEINVEFSPNVFKNTYDVDLRIDGKRLCEIRHGESIKYEIDLKPGTHTIAFSHIDDKTIKGEMLLEVDGDMNVTCEIKCESGHVVLSQSLIEYQAYYTVSFDENGGEDLEDLKIKAGEELDFDNLETIEREGYIFLGWYLENGDKISSEYCVEDNIILIAQWEEILESEWDYAFYAEFSEYSIYYLFDAEENRFVTFSTSDSYIDEGDYDGDISSYTPVELIYDNSEFAGCYEYFQNLGYGGKLTDFNGLKHNYSIEKYPYRAEAILNEIKEQREKNESKYQIDYEYAYYLDGEYQEYFLFDVDKDRFIYFDMFGGYLCGDIAYHAQAEGFEFDEMMRLEYDDEECTSFGFNYFTPYEYQGSLLVYFTCEDDVEEGEWNEFILQRDFDVEGATELFEQICK